VSAAAVQAGKEATTTIPIVMGFSSDPVSRGFVASLARPGRNITGVALTPENELASKRLELIKEAVPGVARIAVLTTGEAVTRTQVDKARQAAPSLGVKLVVVDVRDADYDRAFVTMVAQGAGALFVVGSPLLHVDRKRVHALAAKHRIPAIYDWRENAEEGGLMAYGGNLAALSQRVAEYVDRILKGAQPADLPVEQANKFELVINLKTAKALGLTIPPSLLARADQVIE
jgi:putative tryptophan/tyrosine transport system substrate-binding protein